MQVLVRDGRRDDALACLIRRQNHVALAVHLVRGFLVKRAALASLLDGAVQIRDGDVEPVQAVDVHVLRSFLGS